MHEEQKKTAHVSKNRKVLMLVAAIFVLPVVASMTLYMTKWRPASTGNHGELIQPVRPIGDKALRSLDGKPVNIRELHGKWTMVHFGASTCSDDCIKNLYYMRQVQAAQGKEADRMQRVFIVTDTKAAVALKVKLADYPDMYVWTGGEKELTALAQSFGAPDEKLAENQGIYLIDPLGNLMMRYAPGTDPAGMRKDIVRLLKYSWVG